MVKDIFDLKINPFIVICGRSRTGKSYFLEDIIPGTFGKKYDSIKYVNPSFYTMKEVEKRKYINWFGVKNIYDNPKEIETPEFFEKLLDEMTEYKKNNPDKKILLLVDDLGFLFQKIKRKDGDFLDKIASRFRHIGTCCILIQDLTQISNFVRKNTTHLVMTNTMNKDVLDMAYTAFNCGYDKKEFFNKFRMAFSGEQNRYTKIFINVFKNKISIIK